MSTGPRERTIFWLGEGINTPPFTIQGRRIAGFLLRRLQGGETIGMPQSRPMPSIGPGVAELRINDDGRTWRIFYRADPDAVVILGVVEKRTQKTPRQVIDSCKQRLKSYDANG